MIHEPFVGEAVVSTAGHDEGKAFVITAIGENPFVFIADGDTRTVAKPKKKKRMHLISFPKKGRNGLEALMQGGQVTDADVRKYLKSLSSGQDT